MVALIQKRYPKSDVECHGDYWEVNVFIDGVLAVTYGDYYHDKGSDKAEAFLDGIRFITKHKIPKEYQQLADIEDYGDV